MLSMRLPVLVFLFLIFSALTIDAQTKPDNAVERHSIIPVIEPCVCPVKVDSSFKTRCGYLVVPENRKKANGKMIRLPFIMALSNNPHKRGDPLLFTSGGPGSSSLGWIKNATKHFPIKERDCIAFEQRGTRYALPALSGNELSDAIKESYRKNLNKDSMVLVGLGRFKKALEDKGIDLSGYNTDETVADIDDLLIALHIDSVNLLGGSYSGGLMLAVLRNDPSRVRSLTLDSPLPTFIPIDEDEPANFNEALNILFLHVEKDSADQVLYGNLKERFQQYFGSIGGKTFYIPYAEKGKVDTLNIQYTRNELLDVIENTLFDVPKIKDIPYMITEMIKGNHAVYIRGRLDDIFENSNGPSGMRISVYCADQTVYHHESILERANMVYPYMEGYHINDVYKAMCDCWPVPPIKPETKQPYYSDKPALLVDGAFDPACRPLYIDMIHHYMPKSQRFVFLKYSHGVGGEDMAHIFEQFLADPYRKIEIQNKDIIGY
jgi:pimeloyl-ACP methyl ester carboxylesterase